MGRLDTVIFDMDGTLLNTLEDIADSVNFIISKYGFPLRTLRDVRQFVGNGAARLLELSIPEGINNPHYYHCLDEFTNYYKDNIQNKSVPFSGILRLLDYLYQRNYKLAIVSNKIDQSVKYLNRKFFGDYIKVAIGESDDIRRKPAPDSVFKVLDILRSTISNAVYVGDSEVDIKTANNAGVVSIGVTWGYRDRKILEYAGADFIISEPMELFDLLEVNIHCNEKSKSLHKKL